MTAIGGYFSLELHQGKEYHPGALRLNTGRTALEYILKAHGYQKVYIPFYTCDVLIPSINRAGVAHEFYSIDDNFEAIFDFDALKPGEAFLCTNYFGLKEHYVAGLSTRCRNLIVDNAQAFFAKPTKADTFYTARKFFGVPDGSYAYSNQALAEPLEKDRSYTRFEHLLRRIDESAESAYPTFVKNDELLNDVPILQMSELTHKLLASIDYEGIAAKRKENFDYLHGHLKSLNPLAWQREEQEVPMVYPFYSDNRSLRKKLIEHRIYTAMYWPNVLDWAAEGSTEHRYAGNIIHLPIDQRMDKSGLDTILEIIRS